MYHSYRKIEIGFKYRDGSDLAYRHWSYIPRPGDKVTITPDHSEVKGNYTVESVQFIDLPHFHENGERDLDQVYVEVVLN